MDSSQPMTFDNGQFLPSSSTSQYLGGPQTIGLLGPPQTDSLKFKLWSTTKSKFSTTYNNTNQNQTTTSNLFYTNNNKDFNNFDFSLLISCKEI